MNAAIAPTVTLSNGVEMPRIGLGTWPMNDAEAAVGVEVALNSGYRLLDTAENYANERGVGEGIRKSGISRNEIFITTKFNRKWHSIEGVHAACEASLARLKVDYIDLLLIHWPNPDQDRYVEAFQGLMLLQKAGLVRAVGTSNFKPAHLQRLFDLGLVPQVNQIQFDPYHLRSDLVALHHSKGIVTEAWSPLGGSGNLLQDPIIAAIAERHACSAAQIVLRWHIQQDVIPLPRSLNPQRMAQNLDVFNLSLSEEEMKLLGGLERADPDMLDADQFGH